MSNWDLFMIGIKLMIFGMGVVYIFLVLMIYSMKFLERLLRPLAGHFESKPGPGPVSSGGAAPDELAAVAAAVCALHRDRASRR